MIDELQKLRSLNKNRDQLLTEIDTKSKQLRESETEVKLLKNDLENVKQNLASVEKKNVEVFKKLEDSEIKIHTGKEQLFAEEKARKQENIENEGKIEQLKQKLMTKLRDASSMSSQNTGDMQEQSGQEFSELLQLCRGDLGEILQKLRVKVQSDATVEDTLRTELLSQGKKMNELRAEHETTLYERMAESA